MGRKPITERCRTEAVWAAVALAAMEWAHPRAAAMCRVVRDGAVELSEGASPAVRDMLLAAHGLALLWDEPGTDRAFAQWRLRALVAEVAWQRTAQSAVRPELVTL